MVTINHLVKAELNANPFLSDMLQQGLLNVSAVAEKLHPKITKALRKNVKKTAIGMAIRRNVQERAADKIMNWKFPADISITMKSEIYETAIAQNSLILDKLFELQRHINKRPGGFLSTVIGINECVILTNQWNQPLVRSTLGKSKIISEKENLGFISIDFEPVTKDIPGIYYQITRALAFNSISIQSMHTIGAEVIFIFSGEQLARAYEVISALVKNKPLL